jgi:hypothetical protein
LANIQLARAVQWMREQLRHSIGQATATAGILDCDTTIKTLCGKQEGAVVSRPKLLNAVGRMTSHSGQQRILLSITHEAADQIKRFVANVRAGLIHVLKNAPQLDKTLRWYALVQYIVLRILASNPRTAPRRSRSPRDRSRAPVRSQCLSHRVPLQQQGAGSDAPCRGPSGRSPCGSN